MDPFESRFERELSRLVAEQRASKAEFLAQGKPTTIEAYRDAAGYIRALDKVTEWCTDLRQSIYGTRDDGE